MKPVFALLALLLLAAQPARAQEGYTALGLGYTAANVGQPKFADLLVQVNRDNTGLTKPFSTDGLHQGFNVLAAFGSGKGLFTLGLSRMGNRYRAEGTIPAVSSAAGSFKVTTRLTQVWGQYDWFLVKILGIGLDGGYSYSNIRDERKDLFFGETNQVVDKKGGLHGGLHATLQVPLGGKAFFQLQPFYLRAFYKNDMDNVAAVYLGQPNGAAKKTALSAAGIHARLGIKVQ